MCSSFVIKSHQILCIALSHFSLRWKEKEEVKHSWQECGNFIKNSCHRFIQRQFLCNEHMLFFCSKSISISSFLEISIWKSQRTPDIVSIILIVLTLTYSKKHTFLLVLNEQKKWVSLVYWLLVLYRLFSRFFSGEINHMMSDRFFWVDVLHKRQSKRAKKNEILLTGGTNWHECVCVYVHICRKRLMQCNVMISSASLNKQLLFEDR